MKKNILFTFLLSLVVSIAVAQKSKKKSAESPPSDTAPVTAQPQVTAAQADQNRIGEHFVRKYALAQRWGDYDVAKDALYDLIIEYPENDSIIFSLAYFYFENQKYTSCAVVCNDLLSRNGKNEVALEMSGVSYENLNILDRALQYYETLFLLTNNTVTLYKMASLQFDLKRYAEVLANADILLTKPEAETLKVVFNDEKEQPQEYSLRAALFNLKGMVYSAQADKVNAKKFFEESIKVEPGFLLAKKNLAALK